MTEISMVVSKELTSPVQCIDVDKSVDAFMEQVISRDMTGDFDYDKIPRISQIVLDDLKYDANTKILTVVMRGNVINDGGADPWTWLFSVEISREVTFNKWPDFEKATKKLYRKMQKEYTRLSQNQEYYFCQYQGYHFSYLVTSPPFNFNDQTFITTEVIHIPNKYWKFDVFSMSDSAYMVYSAIINYFTNSHIYYEVAMIDGIASSSFMQNVKKPTCTVHDLLPTASSATRLKKYNNDPFQAVKNPIFVGEIYNYEKDITYQMLKMMKKINFINLVLPYKALWSIVTPEKCKNLNFQQGREPNLQTLTHTLLNPFVFNRKSEKSKYDFNSYFNYDFRSTPKVNPYISISTKIGATTTEEEAYISRLITAAMVSITLNGKYHSDKPIYDTTHLTKTLTFNSNYIIDLIGELNSWLLHEQYPYHTDDVTTIDLIREINSLLLHEQYPYHTDDARLKAEASCIIMALYMVLPNMTFFWKDLAYMIEHDCVFKDGSLSRICNRDDILYPELFFKIDGSHIYYINHGTYNQYFVQFIPMLDNQANTRKTLVFFVEVQDQELVKQFDSATDIESAHLIPLKAENCIPGETYILSRDREIDMKEVTITNFNDVSISNDDVLYFHQLYLGSKPYNGKVQVFSISKKNYQILQDAISTKFSLYEFNDCPLAVNQDYIFRSLRNWYFYKAPFGFKPY